MITTLVKREKFAESLRRSKRKQIIEGKRMKYQENAGVFRYEEFCRALDNLDWIVIRSAMRNETSA